MYNLCTETPVYAIILLLRPYSTRIFNSQNSFITTFWLISSSAFLKRVLHLVIFRSSLELFCKHFCINMSTIKLFLRNKFFFYGIGIQSSRQRHFRRAGKTADIFIGFSLLYFISCLDAKYVSVHFLPHNI